MVAEALRQPVLSDEGRVVGTLPGSALVGTRYEPLYPNANHGTHRVVAAGFVSMTEGTGVVHIAPGYGADDLEIGLREGWPVFSPVDDDGRFTDQAPEFVQGRFVKDADPDITADLDRRGLLFSAAPYRHTYPLCWRCDTPLLYMARTSWYVRTTERKERLLDVNEHVDWHPDHIKDGRYGDWLRNNIDWALSRERYWGTPLPLWRCGQGHFTPVGSLQELSALARRDVTGMDPHRPAVDEVEIACAQCGEVARRVPEVIDTWYDAGAMPYAQWSYHPALGRGEEAFAKQFPADFIAEGLDQTRGWFYTLMAEGVLLFDQSAYRAVICHGLVVDREGRKMSKSVGNVVDPMALMDRYGADSIRWFFLAGGSPWVDRRVSAEALEEVVRQFLLTLWNVYSFYATYANVDGFQPSGQGPPPTERPPLDRWILSRLAGTVREARERLDLFDATGAGRLIARLIDDLSNWYVRRARRRFWSSARTGAVDKTSAYETLNECLVTLTLLLAPFTPFVTEDLWSNLAAGRDGAPDSVHLADYPQPNLAAIDPGLDAAMQAVRDIVSLGRTVRTNTRTKVRQALARAVVHYAGDHAQLEPLLALAAEELNVKAIEFAESAEQLAGWRAKPNFRVLGPRLGPRVKDVAGVLERDDGTLAGRLARGETVTVPLGDQENVELTPQDVDLAQDVREGWGVAAEGGLTVALDLSVTPELRLEGLARELVRLIQDARRTAGLEVTDRIALGIETAGEVAQALDRHEDYIMSETLAHTLLRGPLPGEILRDTHRYQTETSVDGTSVRLSLAKQTGEWKMA